MHQNFFFQQKARNFKNYSCLIFPVLYNTSQKKQFYDLHKFFLLQFKLLAFCLLLRGRQSPSSQSILLDTYQTNFFLKLPRLCFILVSLIFNFHRTGETDSWRAQQNLVCTRIQEKGAVTPQKTEPDFSVRVQELLVEVWVNSGLLQGQDSDCNSLGAQHAGVSAFEGGRHYCHYPNHSWASGQTTGREHSPTHQQTTGLKFY